MIFIDTSAPINPFEMAKQPQRRPAQPARTQTPAPAPKKPAPVQKMEKRTGIFSRGSRELIYGRENFMLMGIGLGLVLLGLAAMSGGAMPDANTWDESRIYSFRRITLAPILMVAGFVVVIAGIFKQPRQVDTTAQVETSEPA